MRPLHRLAEWEPSGTRVLTVTTLLTWALAAFWFYVGAAGWWHGTKDTHLDRLPWCLGSLFAIAALVQTLVLLWRWEDRRVAVEKDLTARIRELEAECGIGDAP